MYGDKILDLNGHTISYSVDNNSYAELFELYGSLKIVNYGAKEAGIYASNNNSREKSFNNIVYMYSKSKLTLGDAGKKSGD